MSSPDLPWTASPGMNVMRVRLFTARGKPRLASRPCLGSRAHRARDNTPRSPGTVGVRSSPVGSSSASAHAPDLEAHVCWHDSPEVLRAGQFWIIISRTAGTYPTSKSSPIAVSRGRQPAARRAGRGPRTANRGPRTTNRGPRRRNRSPCSLEQTVQSQRLVSLSSRAPERSRPRSRPHPACVRALGAKHLEPQSCSPAVRYRDGQWASQCRTYVPRKLGAQCLARRFG